MEGHTPVLLHESVESLNLSPGDTVIDGTLGLGGHALLLGEAVGKEGLILGIDRDRTSLEKAQKNLSHAPATYKFLKGNFRDMQTLVEDAGIVPGTIQGILLDLGWNSTQLSAGRGFSFLSDEPLLMTYEDTPQEGNTTAEEMINTWSERDLEETIRTLGEERYAGRIAHAITLRRRAAPITTSKDLGEVIKSAVPPWYRNRKIHPATKTFQALRMMVNDELTSLTSALESGYNLLLPNGRFSVITFHSIEDGLVKRTFRSWVKEKNATLIYKKPIRPSKEEIISNSRSRSAKLRTIQKYG